MTEKKLTLTLSESGEITLADEKGRVLKPKGVLLIAHDSEKGECYPVAAGSPLEVAIGLGEAFSRLGDDPWWQMCYRFHLKDMIDRTKALKKELTLKDIEAMDDRTELKVSWN